MISSHVGVVADTEPLHDAAEVGLRGLHQEVEMIVHEHISMHARAEAFGQPSEQFQQVEAVALLEKDGVTIIPAGGDVIASAGDLIAQGPCHANRKAAWRKKVNLNMSYIEM